MRWASGRIVASKCHPLLVSTVESTNLIMNPSSRLWILHSLTCDLWRLVTLPSAQQRLLAGVPSRGALGEALKWIRVQAIVTNTMTVSAKTPKVRQEEILSLSAEPMSAVDFIRLAEKRAPYLFHPKNYQRGCQTR